MQWPKGTLDRIKEQVEFGSRGFRCPMCGGNEYTLDKSQINLPGVTGAGEPVEARNVARATCDHCGFTALYAPRSGRRTFGLGA